MVEKRDYYEVLGVPKNATLDQIKQAYRALARKYHPDVTKEDKAHAEERFKEISEAYEVLVDDEKRKLYDQYGHSGLTGQFSNGGFQWSDFTHATDLRDIFGDMGGFGFGGSLFDALFGMGGRGQQGPHKGQSLRYDVEITLEEAASGGNREVTIPRSVACEACRGTGAKDGKVQTCSTCGGKGQVQHVQQRGYSRFVSVSPCPKCHGSGRTYEQRCPKCDGFWLNRGEFARFQDARRALRQPKEIVIETTGIQDQVQSALDMHRSSLEDSPIIKAARFLSTPLDEATLRPTESGSARATPESVNMALNLLMTLLRLFIFR